MSARDGLPCGKCGANEWGNDRKCKPCVRKRARDWYWNNRERAIETRLSYQREHHEEMLERSRVYRKRNPETRKASVKAWAEKNKDSAKNAYNGRRARLRNADGDYTVDQFRAMCRIYGDMCLCCSAKGVTLSADHVVPLVHGGSNYIGNIQPLCRSCNSKKHTKTVDYRPFPYVE
jgi:5-methylcytosine-specific restriction endonuclease McrA